MDALVPLKPLANAKTRLAAALEADARAALMRSLLARTLTEASAARSVGRIVLVSSEPTAAALADEHGVEHFDDRGLPWNDALAAAIDERVASEAVLILSADLPFVTADDVDALVAALPARGVAIARARDAGTNAVAMRPAGAVATCFGTSSSAQGHADLAAAAGLEAAIVDLHGLAFDVDTPADLRELLPALG